MNKSLIRNITFFLLMFAVQCANAKGLSANEEVTSLPFETTTITNGHFASDTKWYRIIVNNSKYWVCSTNAVYCNKSVEDGDASTYFCFEGDNEKGIRIYNKMLGPDYILYCASDISHEPLVPTKVTEAVEPTGFKLSYNKEGYNFHYYTNPTACINDLSGKGTLALWTNDGAPTNSGNRCVFEEVKSESSQDASPFKTTTIVNGKFADDTKWYKLTINDDRVIEASNDGSLVCYSTDDIENSMLWCFVGDATNGYTVYNRAKGTSQVVFCYSESNQSYLYMLDPSVGFGTTKWMVSTNACGGYNLYYPNNEWSCWNDFAGGGYIALWNDSRSPNNGGSCIYIDEYKEESVDPIDPTDPTEDVLKPIEGPALYVYLTKGGVEAYPKELIESVENDGSKLIITDKDGNVYSYKASEVEKQTEVAPEGFPRITSFKFNNKFNDMLMVDADGVIGEDNSIKVEVGGIGKRLVPSFKVSEDGAVVYVRDEFQQSKVTSRRFDVPTTYTVSYPNYRMLRQTIDGVYGMYPFGRDYKVNVTYLADHPTNEYGVPIIKVVTKDGTMITSKNYYWEATISIDGAGYYPDMIATPMQIKGRGNSSWSDVWGWSSPKNPYRIKFAEKQKPLGMTAGKNWNLIANKQKKSMTTNMVGSRIAEMVDCAGANHFIPVELYINGEYRGSYCLTEKIGISNNSISLDDESNATMLELDQYYDADYKFQTDAKFNGNYIPVNVKYPDFNEDETNLQFDDIRNSFNAFITALKNGNSIDGFVDIPALARFLMVNDLIVNQELMHPKSTFCYNENVLDAESKYVFGPAWDFDWSFGYEGSSTYFQRNAESDYYTLSTMEVRDFIYQLRYCGEEMDKHYYRVWTDFMENHLAELLEYCDDYYQVASKSFDHDNQLWGMGDSSTYAKVNSLCIAWLEKRANYIYNYLSNTLGYADKDYLEPEIDPELVDITDVTTEPTNAVNIIYDMQGRKHSYDLQALPKGMYIINGRKVFKR